MKIAIFDFDGTLSSGYSRYDLGYLMEEKGMIKSGFKDEIKKLQKNYEDGMITYNKKFADDKKIFSKYYEGLSFEEVVKFSKENLNLEESVFPWAKPLIDRLKSAGYVIKVISGSWDFIMKQAKEILEFDDFVSTMFEIKDGKLTGGYDLIVDYKVKQEYTKIFLEGATESIGLGDSVADFEFLKKVDRGYLYNPKKDVIDANKEFGFEVVDDLQIGELNF